MESSINPVCYTCGKVVSRYKNALDRLTSTSQTPEEAFQVLGIGSKLADYLSLQLPPAEAAFVIMRISDRYPQFVSLINNGPEEAFIMMGLETRYPEFVTLTSLDYEQLAFRYLGIGKYWATYEKLVSRPLTPSEAYDLLGISRYCCRRMFLAQAKTITREVPATLAQQELLRTSRQPPISTVNQRTISLGPYIGPQS